MKQLLLCTIFCLSAFAQQTLPEYDEKFELKNSESKKLYMDMLQIKTYEVFHEVCRNPKLSASWLLAEYFLNFENEAVSKIYFFPEGQPVFVLRTFKLDEENVSLIDFNFFTNEAATFIESIMVDEYQLIGSKRVGNNMKYPEIISANSYRNLTSTPCVPIDKQKPD